jgi:hypothetical protein
MVFIATFSFLYVVSFIILKPFRIHTKRPVSTIMYKLSYLLYLIVFLALAYLALFFSGGPGNFDDFSLEKEYIIYYVVIIIAFFLPNIAIMLRRRVKELRVLYNYIFTITNFVITLVLFYIIYLIQWEFK